MILILDTLLCMHKTTDEGGDPKKSVGLMLGTLLYLYKATGHVRDLQRLLILVLKSLFCMHKTTGEGRHPSSLDTLVLSTLLCVLKTTYEVWDPYRLVSLVLKSLFCLQNPQMWAGTSRDKFFWC